MWVKDVCMWCTWHTHVPHVLCNVRMYVQWLDIFRPFHNFTEGTNRSLQSFNFSNNFCICENYIGESVLVKTFASTCVGALNTICYEHVFDPLTTLSGILTTSLTFRLTTKSESRCLVVVLYQVNVFRVVSLGQVCYQKTVCRSTMEKSLKRHLAPVLAARGQGWRLGWRGKLT